MINILFSGIFSFYSKASCHWKVLPNKTCTTKSPITDYAPTIKTTTTTSPISPTSPITTKSPITDYAPTTKTTTTISPTTESTTEFKTDIKTVTTTLWPTTESSKHYANILRKDFVSHAQYWNHSDAFVVRSFALFATTRSESGRFQVLLICSKSKKMRKCSD